MKKKRWTALILAVVMLVTSCCSMLLSCAQEEASDGREYTVTFNANGGTVNPTSATTIDGKLASLPTPIKENTEFLGWYISSSFKGKKLTVDYKYTFSCMIHAKWGVTQSTEYTVSFDPNGGTFATDPGQIVTVNGSLTTLPVDPIPPTNSTFLGWFTERTGGEEVNSLYVFSGAAREVTVYAHYFTEYVITFDAGEGSVQETSRITANGKLVGALPKPTDIPDGTRFIGWYTERNGGKPVSSDTVFSENCSIYAYYLELGRYIITIDVNGGVRADDVTQLITDDKGKLESIPASPTPKKGYEFVAWFTRKTGGYKVDEETVFTNDGTIFAQYRLVEFWVSFEANGGRLSESTSMMTVERKLERLPYRPFAPAGKRFIGWFTAKTDGDKVDTEYEFKGTPSTVKVYAHYGEFVERNEDGLWTDADDAEKSERKGDFKNPSADEVWAYDIQLQAGVALEIWYKKELITNVVRDPYSTPKVVLSPDKMLRLADGADVSNSVINVLYNFNTKVIYIQEIIRAEILDDDGIYIESIKQYDLEQNLAKAEVMAEKVVIGTGGTTELTIVLGGKTADIAHFGKDGAVRAQLASNKKNVILAEGTYTIYYNYGETDPSSADYKNLWIAGTSTGPLPDTGELGDSPYYMVGESPTLGLDWKVIDSISLIPDAVHLRKVGPTTYSITVDLYTGNQFKILRIGSGWDGAYTFLSLDGNTGSREYFQSSNVVDKKNDNNVYVKTSGNYTFTIDESTRKLTFVRNGEAEDVKLSFDIYIYGKFTDGWSDRLAVSDKSAGTITFEFTFTAGLEFGIRTKKYNQAQQAGWAAYGQVVSNNTNDGITRAETDNNMLCSIAGTYRFTFTLDNNGLITSIKIDTVQ
ncbi:MAG: InlB B-repeat-containing protein [Clostridiales bacterium]|nr:InlB B-repeat-containing protein [Clostridiales bacterium]